MDWNMFWSSMLGSSVPGSIISAPMLFITHRNNKALELHRKTIQQDIIKFGKWHEERAKAVVTIFSAFYDYLEFLHKILYPSTLDRTVNIDPHHKFIEVVTRQLVYSNDVMADKILNYQSELLYFWNWAHGDGRDDIDERRRRLEEEIPQYIFRLRRDINEFLDPNYQINGQARSAS